LKSGIDPALGAGRRPDFEGIALRRSAQQAADWLRWEGEVKSARAAIHAEMGVNNSRLFGAHHDSSSAQSLTHFPRDELARISRYYIALENFRDWEATEREAWRTLSVLRQPPKGIDNSDLLRLRAVLMTARDTARLIKLSATRQINLINEIGATAVAPDRERTEKFCTLDCEPYNEWSLSREQLLKP